MGLSRVYQLVGLLILMNTNKKPQKCANGMLRYTNNISGWSHFLSGYEKKQLIEGKESDDKKK